MKGRPKVALILYKEYENMMRKYIIPIFIPHYGCPHQCVFCNQRKITGLDTPVSAAEVVQIIEQHIGQIHLTRYIEVAFYGGSFTALPLAKQSQLLLPAYSYLKQGKINAIRLSTRPDCISAEIVANLKKHGVSTVELGVQSMDDNVLLAAERGHTAADVVSAVKIVRQGNLQCGIQVMPGLPGEDWSSILLTAKRVAALRPDFTRIYPTIVIADTKLADLYKAQLYKPLSLSEAIRRSAFLQLLFLQYGIKVIRIGLQATAELDDKSVVLAGPYHPAFGEMVQSYIFNIMAVKFLESLPAVAVSIKLHHHPRDTSKIRGSANANVKYWRQRYPHAELDFIADGTTTDELTFEYQHNFYVINFQMLKIL